MRATSIPNKGTSLVEVMAAILIFVMGTLGSSILFVYGRSQIALQKHYRVALELVSQSMENLKAANYADITAGDTDESLCLEDLSYSRRTHTVVLGTCKQIEVTVNWQQTGKVHNISAATLIGPK
jgi:Tfp pilus assembly protein PilV